MSDALPPRVLNAEEARRLTDDIRTALVTSWALVEDAYVGRAWAALGYPSWQEYCEHEFEPSRPRLAREERSEIVASLRDAGLSVRAIAAATGESRSTIGRELAGVPTGTREAVIGIDGKTYQASTSGVAIHPEAGLAVAAELLAGVVRHLKEHFEKPSVEELLQIVAIGEQVRDRTNEIVNRALRGLGFQPQSLSPEPRVRPPRVPS